MNWYPWLNVPYRQLLAQHQSGRGHHALLLHAIAGMGEASLVYALARWLLCQHPLGEKSCGQCHACRLMTAGTHPDWHCLQAEKGKSTLGVEPVRQIIEQLQSHAQQGGAKIVWIARCEQLSEAAANALLKTLEEPPAQTYFLLTTREPAQLLPTLRSRCFYLYLAPPAESHSLHWLQQQQPGDPQAMHAALRLCAGAPLAALALLQPARWAQREAVCQALSQALASQQWLDLLPSLNQEDVAERLGWLCALLLDAQKRQLAGTASIANCDQVALVNRLAETYAPAELQRLWHAWVACRHQLLATPGINRELLLMRQLCA
ncbi:DNA polymerase III subunit delta' [Edwardsiella hoshinae]|uniref:DNA polymerase III subunit delta' n=1 Tax=Edwardsiella hoshinae TaxID=93378 RepID=A0A376DCL3_9GAMM|nr:DNA polymerase III subunit delta' [Edwardsiella hoshinae]AOV96642.1 DNA polymerase III subunit delta' [Edwardsiella hoshinae]QPR27465.1 DNA polymerase III subunit delta' [Edwardsiella hoshinae]STC87164.1 DNA polymerase III subunit delta' [Edwardsiella hoshinae]